MQPVLDHIKALGKPMEGQLDISYFSDKDGMDVYVGHIKNTDLKIPRTDFSDKLQLKVKQPAAGLSSSSGQDKVKAKPKKKWMQKEVA